MNSTSVLSNGTRLDHLERAANILERNENLSPSDALDRIAAEQGFSGWNALVEGAWSLDDDNDIKSSCIMPGRKLKTPIFSRLLDVDEDLDLDGTWSVNMTVRLTTDTREPYLYVSFVAEGKGSDFEIDSAYREAFERAIETGDTSDAIAAQGALIEWILTWFEGDWLDGLTCGLLCELERRRRGISDDDLVWEEPGGVSYGPDHSAVRVYRAGAERFLVCYESDCTPGEEDADYIKPFALITRAEFDSVPIDPYNFQAAHRGFREVARMI